VLNYRPSKDTATGKTHSAVTFLPVTMEPAAYTIPPRAPRGTRRAGAGRPRKCLSCGSAHLVERTILETECLNCGDILRGQVGHDHEVNAGVESDEPTGQESGNHGDEIQTYATWGERAEAAGDTQWSAPPASPSPVEDAEGVTLTAPPMNSGLADSHEAPAVDEGEASSSTPEITLQELRSRLHTWAEARAWSPLIMPPAHRCGGSRENWGQLLRGGSVDDLRRVYMAMGGASGGLT
jgi:hypothetical protein